MGFLGSVTGSSGAKAAKSAAQTVTRGEEENQQTIIKLRKRLLDRLDPFTQVEEVGNDRLLSVLNGETSIQDDPLFKRTLDQSLDTVDRNFTAGRKAFSGQRAQALRDTSINAQNQFFDRLRDIAQPRVTGQINATDANSIQAFNAANSAAHGAHASGQIGAANARQAGFNNLLKIGSAALTGGASLALPTFKTQTPSTQSLPFNPNTGVPLNDIGSRLRIGSV